MLFKQRAGNNKARPGDGLKSPAAEVLAHLDGDVGTTVSELASGTLRTPAEIRRILAELAEKGFTQPLSRGRNAVVRLTPEGKQEARRLGLRSPAVGWGE